MKLDVKTLRYLSKDDFRVLQAIEVGQKNVRMHLHFSPETAQAAMPQHFETGLSAPLCCSTRSCRCHSSTPSPASSKLLRPGTLR